MVVPDEPRVPNGADPAFWFGVQTADGNGALVQPIMAQWLGLVGECHCYKMFQEIFDWTNEHNEDSPKELISPGEQIKASITYIADSNSYIMNMTSSSGKVSNFHYQLLDAQKETESVAYFVLEHRPPNSCNQFPSNGIVSWRNIHVEVNGVAVPDAEWVAKQEKPACGSVATVINSTAIDITWNPDADQ
eukprot:CAMPEP_0201521770 /NCGR_PEP_ID=MMETSP0161_2-20130828/16148_1 /ASSEMBLY_ACC=CAM_ASM_000251 /TAXON_ID=180227 /ORGANISM="Neoparamoeba aestuarina, Strain SoJaBio B1-5/56/2" /LENGTH=189 /DNA_ID=CAMNT_0047920471 /DNA_START=186 /DNA_END=755 /DNA_ORIENTATION=-